MATFDLAKVRVAGSAEEVREVGVDPKLVYTCGPDRPGVRRCPLAESCEFAQKELTGHVTWNKDGQQVQPLGPSYANLEGATREGPGPLNIGFSRTKIIGGTKFRTVNATCACWEYPYQKERFLAVNEGGKKPVALIKVIAIEGQPINLPGSLPVPQEDGKIIHVLQKGGVKTVIKPFVRPNESDDFAASAATMAEINREEAASRGTSLREFVRLAPGEGGDASTATNAGATRRGAASRG